MKILNKKKSRPSLKIPSLYKAICKALVQKFLIRNNFFRKKVLLMVRTLEVYCVSPKKNLY